MIALVLAVAIPPEAPRYAQASTFGQTARRSGRPARATEMDASIVAARPARYRVERV
jgi:hypothetical protein